MDLAKSLANIAFFTLFFSNLKRILFLNIVVNFWLETATLVMVKLLIDVYIVLNFCQLRGLLLEWKLLAGSVRFLFSMLYTITISHLLFYFSSSPLDVLRRKESRIGGFFPSSSANPTIHS